MTEPDSDCVCVACSVLRLELEALREAGDIDFSIHYSDSMLHMRPTELRERLGATLGDITGRGTKVLLVYGDCHSHMDDFGPDQGVWRLPEWSCAEMLLGHDVQRRLRREGCFFLLPEWTFRWRETFERELGLTGDVGKELMRDMHKKLLYLDTGRIPVPMEHLRDASEATGLPWEIIRVDLDNLRAAIRASLKRMDQYAR